VAAAMAVAIAAAAVGFGTVSGLRWLGNRPVPMVVAPHPVPISALPRPVPTGVSPGVTALLRVVGPVFGVAASRDAIYAAYSADPSTDRTRIARLDLATRAVVRSPVFRGSIWLADAGGSLWTTAISGTGPGLRHLYQLDPATLAVVRTIDLSVVRFFGSPGQIVATPFGLWVANGPNIVLVNPSDGAILRAVTANSDAEVGALAVDPSGNVLYVSTHVSGEASAVDLSERDADTGRVRVVGSLRGFDLGVNSLSATNDGVWVATPTGMMGFIAFRATSDLGASPSPRGLSGTNGIHGQVAQGVLWVLDDMVGKLSCADPVTGHVSHTIDLAPLGQPSSVFSDTVASVDGRVFLGAGDALLRISPRVACGS